MKALLDDRVFALLVLAFVSFVLLVDNTRKRHEIELLSAKVEQQAAEIRGEP